MERPSITGLKKRQQIQSANKTMFVWVVIAATAVTICLVLAQFLVRQFLFNVKIINAKSQTNQTLITNAASFTSVKDSVNKLIADSKLTKLRVAPEDTALQVIIDALPTVDDRAALGTSLQQKVFSRSGVAIDSLNVIDASVAASEPSLAGGVTQPQEIIFSVALSGSYEQVRQAIDDLNKSIRPFDIQTIRVSGDGGNLSVNISLKTFYLPKTTVQLRQEPIKP